MKANLLPLSCLLSLLAGCAPLSIYHKEGTSVSRMQSDLLSCEVAAAQDVPIATELRREPPYYVPGDRVCYSNGKCYLRGGYYIPGRVYTVDANRGLRSRVQAQCMADQGYSPVTLPQLLERRGPAGPAGGHENPAGAGRKKLCHPQ